MGKEWTIAGAVLFIDYSLEGASIGKWFSLISEKKKKELFAFLTIILEHVPGCVWTSTVIAVHECITT